MNQEFKEAFDAAVVEMKDAVVARDAELKATGELSEKTKEGLVAAEAKLLAFSGEIQTLVKRIDELETQTGRPDLSGQEKLMSLGEQLVSAEGFEMIAKRMKSDPILIKGGSIIPHLNALGIDVKGLTSDSGSAGAAAWSQRLPGIYAPDRLRAPRIRSLIPTMPTSNGSIEYVRETNFHQLYAEMLSAVTTADDTIELTTAAGFKEGQSVTINPGQGSEETKIVKTGGIDLDSTPNTVQFTAVFGSAFSAGVAAVADEFVCTPEMHLKPQASATFSPASVPVQTLAHWLPASRQILSDAPALRAFVDNRMSHGLALSEETMLLYGDGGSEQIQGILTDPDINTYSWSAGTVGDKKLDAIRRGMTFAQLAHYPVDGIVINPVDWEDIELSKGTDGHYLWVTVPDGAQLRVWRVPVVVTTAIVAGTCLVGAFGLGSAIHDRMMTEMRVSEHHDDFFTRNAVAILIEERLAQTIYRPPAFTEVTFDSAPT